MSKEEIKSKIEEMMKELERLKIEIIDEKGKDTDVIEIKKDFLYLEMILKEILRESSYIKDSEKILPKETVYICRAILELINKTTQNIKKYIEEEIDEEGYMFLLANAQDRAMSIIDQVKKKTEKKEEKRKRE